jgi:hypothetical protein
MKKIYLLILLSVNFIFIANAQKATDIATATKGLTVYKGYFNFYWDENTGKILLEVDKLNTEFLYVNSLPSGVGSNDLGLDRGQIGDSRIVKFVKSGPKVLLVQPNYAYRAVSNNADERKSVEEAFAQSVLWGFKAEAQEDGKVLIDFTPFLLRDAHHIADRLGSQGSYSLDDSRSAVYMPNTKAFPDNSEFEATITVAGRGRGSEISSVTPDPN